MSRSFKPIELFRGDLNKLHSHSIAQHQHVFIEGNSLLERWRLLNAKDNAVFSIGEIKFGLGLNFLLTWSLWERYAPRSASLHFISCEPNPLFLEELAKALMNWPELEFYTHQLVKQYPPLTPGTHHLFFAQGRIKLTLMLGECYEQFEQLLTCGDSVLERQLTSAAIDAWYLNPSKDALWPEHLGTVLSILSNPGATYATFAGGTLIDDSLRQNGFSVTKTEHYTMGCLESNFAYRIRHRTTPWHASAPPQPKKRTVFVVGAGLAGCFISHELAQRGWNVTLFDENNQVGQGASGNQRAVLFPKLSAFRSPFTEFMLAAFLYAHRIYRSILESNHFGVLNGSLSLPFNQKEQQAQDGLGNWLAAYPELGRLVDASEASVLAGIPLSHDGLFIPYSGWMDSPALCQFLTQHHNISLITKQSVNYLHQENEQWWIKNESAPILILANGFKINQFSQTKHLPIKPIRGQMTAIKSAAYNSLKIPVCAQGHIVPYNEELHHVGATYDLSTTLNCITKEDDQLNVDKLADISAVSHHSMSIVSSWAGVRASTPDYLPLVGSIAQAESFLSVYTELERNAKAWIPNEAPMYSGLYAFSGFGSRGLTTIPLAAHWLAALINNEVVGAPRNLVQSLSPARFLRRSIIKRLS